jgi:hypothetical protein
VTVSTETRPALAEGLPEARLSIPWGTLRRRFTTIGPEITDGAVQEVLLEVQELKKAHARARSRAKQPAPIPSRALLEGP